LASIGIAPNVTLGPRVGVGLRWEQLAVWLEGRVDAMPIAATTELGDRIDAIAMTIGPSACAHLDIAMGCAGVQLGAFMGRAFETTDPAFQTSFFATFDVAAGVSIPLVDVVALRALVELRVPLVRIELSIDAMPVWNTSPVAGSVSVGVDVRIL
jgi:hypothetical protein